MRTVIGLIFTVFVLSWTFSFAGPGDFVLPDGTVTIGSKTASGFKLSIQTSKHTDGLVLRNDASGGGAYLSWNSGDGAAGGGYLSLRNNAGSYRAKIRSYAIDGIQAYFIAGNVGIGTSQPRHLLDLGYSLGKKLAVYQGPQGNSFYGFGISSNTLEIYAGADVNDSPGMVVKKTTGYVGIGVEDPLYNLDVKGDINASGKIYQGGASILGDGTEKPDYVFQEGYDVMTTEDVAKYLEEEKSLPWITSSRKEKEENGNRINMTRMSFETLEAVENLQLQAITQAKIIKDLQSQMKEQQTRIEYLLKQVKN